MYFMKRDGHVYYDFRDFTPQEFEKMIQSLAQGIAGPDFVLYGKGPDGQREFKIPEANIQTEYGEILGKTYGQVKYKSPDTPTKDWSWLKSNLKKELEGFADKNDSSPEYLPETWWFFTNIILTPVLNKGTRDLAENYVKGFLASHSIKIKFILYGKDDICAMLDNNTDVRETYFPSSIREPIIGRVSDRTDEYRLNWEANLFLNDFDPEDENAQSNIQLKKLYIIPNYLFKTNSTISENLDHFLLSNERSGLLILGYPGIGKSTVISWFLNNYGGKRRILVYRFSDFPLSEWKIRSKQKFSDFFLEQTGLTKAKLKHTILIFDGYDEIIVGSSRTTLINSLVQDLQTITALSLIITCRANYIKNLANLEFSYITLQPLNSDQITNYIRNFKKCSSTIVDRKTLVAIHKKTDIFGIPLILYMVLALSIKLEEESSMVDVYDRVFQLDGGVYDRCINRKKYDLAKLPHEIVKNIKTQIHQFSRDIAFWIYENNPSDASIPFKQYSQFEINHSAPISSNYLMGSFFQKNPCTEGYGSEKISFIHRSIYEYFVVERFYSQIEQLRKTNADDINAFAKIICSSWKTGDFTPILREYFYRLIAKYCQTISIEQKQSYYCWWENAAEAIIKNGACFCLTLPRMPVLEEQKIEAKCLSHLGVLLTIVRAACHIEQLIFETKIKSSDFQQFFSNAIKHVGASQYQIFFSNTALTSIKLGNAFLRRADFKGSDLRKAYFYGADLHSANLHNANLQHANLKNAICIHADLSGADLRGAELEKMVLKNANLNGVQLTNTQVYAKDRPDFFSANFDHIYVNGREYLYHQFESTFRRIQK